MNICKTIILYIKKGIFEILLIIFLLQLIHCFINQELSEFYKIFLSFEKMIKNISFKNIIKNLLKLFLKKNRIQSYYDFVQENIISTIIRNYYSKLLKKLLLQNIQLWNNLEFFFNQKMILF